jgi:hypothetical protein
MQFRLQLGTWAALALLVACSQKPQTKPTPPDGPNKTETSNNEPIGSSNKNYGVAVNTSSDPKVGTPFTATVVLTPSGEFHVNKDFPHSIKLGDLPTGVECQKTELKTEDAKKMDDARAEFEISCTAKEAGAKEFSALYKLGVCTENGYCQSPKEKLAWKVDVK